MNFLFGLLLALTSSLFVFTVWYVTPLKEKIPAKPVYVTMVVLALLSVWSNLGTYGPRNSLSSNTYKATATRTEVQPSTEFIESSDRVGQFDEKLEQDKP